MENKSNNTKNLINIFGIILLFTSNCVNASDGFLRVIDGKLVAPSIAESFCFESTSTIISRILVMFTRLISIGFFLFYLFFAIKGFLTHIKLKKSINQKNQEAIKNNFKKLKHCLVFLSLSIIVFVLCYMLLNSFLAPCVQRAEWVY